MQDFQGPDSTETDTDGTHGHTPNFTGIVVDAGGGHVDILVDRDTDYYPESGAHVRVVAADETEATIRADERAKIAQLIEDEAETLARFVTDPANLLTMVAYLLRLGGAS